MEDLVPSFFRWRVFLVDSWFPPKCEYIFAGWHESPHTLAGWVSKFYFVKISLPFRVIRKLYSLCLMHDDDLLFALKQMSHFRSCGFIRQSKSDDLGGTGSFRVE